MSAVLQTRMHPSYTWGWLALHSWGLIAWALPWDTWKWYYLTVACFEAVGLIAAWISKPYGRMWSPHVWAWMADELGKHIGWRVFVVAAWTLYFAGAFMVVRPWFGDLDALIGIAFLVWVWAHFLHTRESERRPHG